MTDSMMTSRKPSDLIGPATRFAKITPGSSDLPGWVRAVHISVGGTIDVLDWDGHAETDVSVQSGLVLPVSFKRITAASGGAVVYGIGG
jgi:hypothetical protein